MLSFLLLTPLIGSLYVLLFDDTTQWGRIRVKRVTLVVTLLSFLLSLGVLITYDSGTSDYQAIQWGGSIGFCHFHMGVDALSLNYILLTTTLFPVSILASWENVESRQKSYFSLLLIVETLLISVFSVLDLLLFYVAFEASLVPLFLIIGIWGGSDTRIRAALLLFLYTLGGSLFMLISIVSIANNLGTSDFTTVRETDIAHKSQNLLWLGFFLALAVKTPLIPFHMWLPRAHAEAPLAGSMILAGSVLKVASYGFMRIVIPILPNATYYYTPLVETVSIVTIFYSSLAAMRQWDTKAFVAYSSVGHIGVVTLGIFSNTVVGISGAYLLSIAHGFISPVLFIIVGGVLYDRFHTRTISYYRGLHVYIPFLAFLFFLTACANIGVPLSLNWLGEFLSLAGAFQRSPITGGIASISILVSAGYTIWIWTRMVNGTLSPYLNYANDITRREVIVILPLLILTLVLGIIPYVILENISVVVTSLLYLFNLYVTQKRSIQ